MNREEYDILTSEIIGAAIEVHRADKKLGLLINFNVPVLKQGIKRKINGIIN